MPAKNLAISHVAYPFDYNKNNPASDDQFNRLANYHRKELIKMLSSQWQQEEVLYSQVGEEMESLLDQAQELITTNYKRP